MSDEPITCLANPVKWGPPAVDSLLAKCAECGCAVWRAISTPKHDRIICIPCAVDLVDWSQAKILPLTEAQKRDMKRRRS